MADDGVTEEAGGALAAAARRLETALEALERRLAEAQAREVEDADLFAAAGDDLERERLAAALEAARAREKALEQVAAEASAALGRAAAEVRAALSAEEA